MFYSYFERNNYKALTFNIVHFANFEIRAALLIWSFILLLNEDDSALKVV